MLALAVGHLSFSAETEFDQAARRANEAREAARVNDAIELYQKALRLKPDWDEGRWYLGTLLYSADRSREALSAFRFVLERYPRNGAAWAFTGMCQFELGEHEQSLEAFVNARALGVGDNAQLVTQTRYHLGILFNKFGRFDEARAELEILAQHHRDEEAILPALGLSVLLIPHLPSELPPEKRDLVMLAGRAAYQNALKQREQAGKSYQELAARYADTPNVHYAYGVFLVSDDPDKAVAEFRRELAVSSDHVPARLQLVAEFLRRNDARSALPPAREAVDLGPESYLTRQMLGRVLLQMEEVDGAIRELEAAVKLSPDNPENHFQLARAYRAAGRREDAAREQAEFTRLNQMRKE